MSRAAHLIPSGKETLRPQKGLSAREVDRRLVALARAHRQIESALCFYLQEVEDRQLYLEYGHASTVDYARERLGLEDHKTRALIRIATRVERCPELKRAFSKGELPWTKVREVAKVVTPETERDWLGKCHTLTNRQLEQEVRRALPPVKKKVLTFVLEGELVDVWEQTREAIERLAGKSLTDLEVLDLLCAEALCTYAVTPAFPSKDEAEGGFVRKIIERDRWRCTRPGCSSRTALTGNHIRPRARGGTDDESNLHTVCAVCHRAITDGRLKVRGRAPHELIWEGPFGVIEKPLPLAKNRGRTQEGTRQATTQAPNGEPRKTTPAQKGNARIEKQTRTKGALLSREASVEYRRNGRRRTYEESPGGNLARSDLYRVRHNAYHVIHEGYHVIRKEKLPVEAATKALLPHRIAATAPSGPPTRHDLGRKPPWTVPRE